MNIKVQDFRKINEFEWEISASYRKDMRVPVRIFATYEMLVASLGDLSYEQAMNAATLPGLAGPVVVMPDVHQGYGFPIGGVAAMDFTNGIISPGAIGYDINCGVRLLTSSIPRDAVARHMDELASALNAACPSGVGTKGIYPLTSSELEQVCRQGSVWALKKGLASEEDIRRTEEGGCLAGADPAKVSSRSTERGRGQLGTLGSGNHFIEIDYVAQVLDPASAHAMGLYEDCLTVQIHCGSRGFGHQICTDYVQSFQTVVKKFGIVLPDRELVCAPLDSTDGKAYLAAMRCAANYAFANRQLLAYAARQAFEQVLAGTVSNWHLQQVYDVAHNMGKIETHTIGGKAVKVCVHRKGATRAFGPGTPGLPEEYQRTGQPVLVPGSMGSSSWVLAGTQVSMERSYGSSCHGAGRVMSRSKAKQMFRGSELRRNLEDAGIKVRAGSLAGLSEEAPQAYKDVDEVVEIVVGAGIARKVARLRPLAVIKG